MTGELIFHSTLPQLCNKAIYFFVNLSVKSQIYPLQRILKIQHIMSRTYIFAQECFRSYERLPNTKVSLQRAV